MNRMAKYRYQAICTGILCTLVLIVFLSLPQQEYLHKKGPMITGHTDLSCQSCHQKAKGTMRQQIQAKVKYLLSLRGSDAVFGSSDVNNETCQSCHEKPNDRHPVLRFTEPRFVKARAAIAPHRCESCHREHSGARVTIQQDFCKNCHQDTNVKNDPLEISHQTLIKNNQWNTCLQCHDFHGNYVRKLTSSFQDTIPDFRIQEYFKDGVSPYGQMKEYEAKKIIAYIEKLK
jgi:hypothetical protein